MSENIYPSMQDEEEQIEVIPGEEGQPDVLIYPSLQGKGFEEVSIPRPHGARRYGINYPSMEPGADTIQIKDAVPLISKRINEGFSNGNYGVLNHYATVLEGSDFFDQKLIPTVKAFVEEAKGIKNREEGQALLERVNGFLSNIRMERRPGL